MTARFFTASLSTLVDSLYIISQPVSFVNTFFKSFFKLFFKVLRHLRALPALADSFIIIALCLFFVNCEFLQNSALSTNPKPHF